MEDKVTKKPTKKATTSLVKESSKVSNSPIMEVVVTARKFGNYKKGDTITMHHTTAKGCIKHGVVEAK